MNDIYKTDAYWGHQQMLEDEKRKAEAFKTLHHEKVAQKPAEILAKIKALKEKKEEV